MIRERARGSTKVRKSWGFSMLKICTIIHQNSALSQKLPTPPNILNPPQFSTKENPSYTC